MDPFKVAWESLHCTQTRSTQGRSVFWATTECGLSQGRPHTFFRGCKLKFSAHRRCKRKMFNFQRLMPILKYLMWAPKTRIYLFASSILHIVCNFWLFRLNITAQSTSQDHQSDYTCVMTFPAGVLYTATPCTTSYGVYSKFSSLKAWTNI